MWGFSSGADIWASTIRLFASFVLLAGIFNLVMGLAGPAAVSWSSLLIGGIYMMAGALGLHAGYTGKIESARAYVATLVVATVTVVVVEIIDLTTQSPQVRRQCEARHLDHNECDKLHHMYLLSGLIGIAAALFCCSGCIGAANSYYQALKVERGGMREAYYWPPMGLPAEYYPQAAVTVPIPPSGPYSQPASYQAGMSQTYIYTPQQQQHHQHAQPQQPGEHTPLVTLE